MWLRYGDGMVMRLGMGMGTSTGVCCRCTCRVCAEGVGVDCGILCGAGVSGGSGWRLRWGILPVGCVSLIASGQI